MDPIICLLYSCCQTGNNTVISSQLLAHNNCKISEGFLYLKIKVLLYLEFINTGLYFRFPFRSASCHGSQGFFSSWSCELIVKFASPPLFPLLDKHVCSLGFRVWHENLIKSMVISPGDFNQGITEPVPLLHLPALVPRYLTLYILHWTLRNQPLLVMTSDVLLQFSSLSQSLF